MNLKKTKKNVFTVVILVFSKFVFSQSGWVENQFYSVAGGNEIICSNYYNIPKSDGFYSWIEVWQDCQQRNWHNEYRSGYIYFWGANGWYSQWQEGYFWYFTWRNFSQFVRRY